MLPISTVILVIRDLSILLVKNEKKEWTLPGGLSDTHVEEVESIGEFAREALFPFFHNLAINSVHLFMPPIDGMVFHDERTRVAIFECKIKGDSREAERKGLVWFAPIKSLPPHVVTPDMRGVTEMIAAHSRFHRG